MKQEQKNNTDNREAEQKQHTKKKRQKRKREPQTTTQLEAAIFHLRICKVTSLIREVSINPLFHRLSINSFNSQELPILD